MSSQLDALHDSAARLARIVEPLTAGQLRSPAYPTEWSIADVLSHVGSGATIMQLRLDAALAGHDLTNDLSQPIWDDWNAKTPEVKATDAIAADRALLERVESLTPDERDGFTFSMGPMQFDLAGFLGLRLNEHALHTWDIEVALEPVATLPSDAAGWIIDNLAMIVRYSGRPTGLEHDVHVRTTDPARDLTLALGSDAVSLSLSSGEHAPDLELPAEALIRLAYGRLDPDHTPPVRGSGNLAELRLVFPGV
jgi:uncharacterized protein (TIGR03083 family)